MRSARRKIELGDYQNLVLGRDEQFPGSLPTHVRVIDDAQMHRVDLDAMTLPSSALDATFRLRSMAAGLAAPIGEVAAAVILDALNGRRKVSTAHGWHSILGYFLRRAREAGAEKTVCSLTLPMFLGVTSSWGASHVKTLRGLLRFWVSRGYPGLSADLKQFILRSHSPKPRSTTEIQADVPRERPFSIEQVAAILQAIDDAYIADRYSPQDNLLWKLIVSEALRPGQLAALRVEDIKLIEAGNWRSVELMVPWVKQHGKGTREHMVPLPVSSAVGHAIKDQIQFLTALHGAPLHPEFALFSAVRDKRKRLEIRPGGVSIIALISRTRREISRVCDGLENLDLFTRRFKHTKLTHLALLGAPVDVLARAAFQTTLGTVSRYVNMNEEAFSDYESKMASHYSWLAGCFTGKIEHSVQMDAANAAVLSSDLEHAVGRCADSPCGVLAPFGCYVCPRFVAFSDGPHREVRQELLDLKAVAVAMKLPKETIERNDRLIAAVEFVIDAASKDSA